MPDAAAISAVITSLKAATDIAKFIRQTDTALEQAELKNKLADMIGALADAKFQAVEVRDELAIKDARIAELEDAFRAKEKLIRREDAYYHTDDAGAAIGAPLCARCWDVDHRQYRLVFNASTYFNDCVVCKAHYTHGKTLIIPDELAE
jgi:hypothetical protein